MGGVPAEPFPRACRSRHRWRLRDRGSNTCGRRCRGTGPGARSVAVLGQAAGDPQGAFVVTPRFVLEAGRLDIPRRPRRAVRSPRRAAPVSPVEVRARARYARAPKAPRWPPSAGPRAPCDPRTLELPRGIRAEPLGPVVASQQQPRVLVLRGIATDLLAAGDRVVVHPLARERLGRLPKMVDGRLQVPLVEVRVSKTIQRGTGLSRPLDVRLSSSSRYRAIASSGFSCRAGPRLSFLNQARVEHSFD